MDDNSTGIGNVAHAYPNVAGRDTNGDDHDRDDRDNDTDQPLRQRKSTWRSNDKHFAHVQREPQWTVNLENLITMYRDKCSQRILVHRESANYYSLRLKYITVPAGVLGAVGTSTVFATWKSDFCDSPLNQYTSLGAGICMLISTALGALVAKSQYPAMYAAHLKSYRNFDKLLKRLTVELCFEPAYREMPREFISKMLQDYDRYSDESELVPSAVEKKVTRVIEDAARRYQQETERNIEENSAPSPYEMARSDSSDQEKAGYFRAASARARAIDPENGGGENTDGENKDQLLLQQQRQNSEISDRRAVPSRAMSKRAPKSTRFAQSTRRKNNNGGTMMLFGGKSRYCKGMPLTSMIELDAVTYEEQTSVSNGTRTSTETDDTIKFAQTHSFTQQQQPQASTRTVQNRTQSLRQRPQRPQRQRKQQSEPLQNRSRRLITEQQQQQKQQTRAVRLKQRGKHYSADDVTQMMASVNEQSHHDLVRSAYAKGMIDMAASHPSNSSTPDEQSPVRTTNNIVQRNRLERHDDASDDDPDAVVHQQNAMNNSDSCSDCSHGHNKPESGEFPLGDKLSAAVTAKTKTTKTTIAVTDGNDGRRKKRRRSKQKQ